VTIHPVRVFGCGNSGAWSDIIAGIDWVTANRILPAVANLSLGGGANTSVDTAVNNMINSGVTAVIAAGNSGIDACGFSPARVANAITVGSTDSNDARSSFSNIGSCLDIFAPGGGILSAWWTGNTASNTISGTSMASPHVAGAAALHLATNPSATPAQVATALINNATLNKVTSAGAGSPNRLLYTLSGSSNPSPPTITSFLCPDYNNSGGNTYWCSVVYTSSTPATVTWPAGGSAYGDEYYRQCSTNQRLTVTVTVTNAGGSTSRTSPAFTCPSGPIP
jgi:subtilisin family serine protease